MASPTTNQLASASVGESYQNPSFNPLNPFSWGNKPFLTKEPLPVNKNPTITSDNQALQSPGGIPKPTTAVSSNAAATKADTTIKTTMNNGITQQSTQQQTQKDLDSTTSPTDKFMKGSGTPNPNYTAPTPPAATTPTPDQQQTDAALHPNQTQLYNTTTGAQEWVDNSKVQNGATSGYSTQSPLARTDVADTVDAADGMTYKKFSDGTYGRFDVSSGTYTPANAAQFQAAKSASVAQTALTNLQNGILSPSQQAQIDQLKVLQAADLKKLQTFIDNNVGATTIAENLFGMGNNLIGKGEITKVITDGAQKVAELQAKQASALSAMQRAFMEDDMNVLKTAYDQYSQSSAAVQKQIDQMQAAAQAAADKREAGVQSIAVAMAKKYTDVSEPIEPGDDVETITEKLKTSPRWQQDQQIASTLTKDENDFWAQMAISGVGKDIAIPGLGLGKAATEAKVQILKTIANNAKNLGMTANEVAQSIMDKTAAGKTYQKLLNQGAFLQAQEKKVEADFKLVKQAAQKMASSDWESGVPWLQNHIRTGEIKFGDNSKVNNYMSLLTTTLTAYAKVIAGATGSAGVTKAANDEAQNLLIKGLSPETIADFVDNAAIPEMKNTIMGYTESLKNMDSAISMANGSISPGTTPLGVTATPSTQSNTTSTPTTNSNGTLQAVDF